MRSTVVLGAAGFVSHYLTPLLVPGTSEIILIDPRPIPPQITSKLENSAVRWEIFKSLSDYQPATGPEVLISLAGQTDVDEALRHPKKAFEANTSIAIQLGEWLLVHGHETKLIYMSSDEVLGESFEPLSEDACLSPTQPYAASKAAAEVIIHSYRDVYKLNVITLRSCNLIGGRQNARKLLPISVESIINYSPIPIYGDGSHRREWLAVKDLCDAILLLAKAPNASGIYQASSHVSLSILEVVKVTEEALGRTATYSRTTDRLVHDKSYAMGTERLNLLGWHHKVNPIEAIATAVREMQVNLTDGEESI